MAIEDRRVALASERGKIARVVRDIQVGSRAFTPLSREGKAIGVMIVARTEVRPFQQSELDLMTGFADQDGGSSPWLTLEIDVCDLLTIGVANDETVRV